MAETASRSPGLSRRAFVQSSTVMGGMMLMTPLAGLQARRRDGPPPMPGGSYGPLEPVVDLTTGLPLLKLPSGFSYESFGWTGDLMDDGTPTPDRHDGMAVVETIRRRGGGSELVLVRNHERGPVLAGGPVPLIGAGQAPVYDGFTVPGLVDGLGGGTTALFFERGRFSGSQGTLAGTLVNCAGGATPWHSWLSCEEVVLRGAQVGAKDHGFVFEVPSPRRGRASAVAIEDMGLMNHEAAAVDPATGDVYLTEDNGPASGFYRFRPRRACRRAGDLERGGRLDMLKVVGVDGADLRQVSQGDSFAVEWVEIPTPNSDPEGFISPAPGFPPIQGAGKSGPYLQGEAQGAAILGRGEGCTYDRGTIYFVDTGAGPVGKGVVWALEPGGRSGRRPASLTAIFVSPNEETADNPDNITVSPRGGLVVCEDGGGQVVDGARAFGTRLLGIDNRGSSFVLAENNVVIDQPIDGRPAIAPEDYRGKEFAGATFSRSGRYLFVNIQSPGVTFAITGPWERGRL